jgi:UDP-glucose 4-epimerase
MRVLVTGSHGFIGSQLVLALKERGDRVFEYDVKTLPIRDILQGPYPGELDEIYHLACVNQEEALTYRQNNLAVNAFGTQLMAELAVSRGARFVYTSTASVYGNAYPIPTDSHRPPDPKSDYAVAKLAGEYFVKNSGADYTVFRLSNVYGPGQTTENPYCGVVAKFFEAAMAGEPLKIIGDGSQTRDFTYVEDILPHLMNPELKGLLNCSHGHERNIAGLAQEVSSIVGVPTHFEWASERPVDGIQRRCLISDVTCPTDLKTGLQRTYDWLRDPPLADSSSFDYSGRKAPL